MGACAGKEYVRHSRNSREAHKRLTITCPICEESYNTEERKPYIVCPNSHQICIQCLTSIRAHNMKQGKELKCPFCNQICADDKMGTDITVYNFLKQEEETLNLLPDDRKKLFAFSSIYLPTLHKLIKDEARAGKKKGANCQSIDTIRIKGRMLEDFEVLELDMFECLSNLRNLYLNNNHIKAFDPANYFRDSIQLLNLADNRIVAMRQLLNEGAGAFKHLKTLILSNNKIEEIGGLSLLQHLQIVNLSSNNIASMKGLECPQTLRHLNLEFNAIKEVQYSDFCSKLFSLRLFGNPVRAECWGKVMEKDWSELRVLTASIKAHTLKAKQSQCATLKQQLRTLNQVFQLGVIESIEGEQREVISSDGPQIFECFSSNYKSESRIQGSELREAMKIAIQRDPLGQNINFKPVHYNKEVYQFDEVLWKYQKVEDSDDPMDYLYSQRSFEIIDNKTKYISIAVSSEDFIVGICQFIAGPTKTVEFDLSMKRLRGSHVQDRPLEPIGSLEKAKRKYVNCQLTLNCAESKLELWIDGYMRECVILQGEKWQQYKFFVSLRQKGSWLRALRQQVCQNI